MMWSDSHVGARLPEETWEVEDWLRSIGLGERISVFRENRISLDLLDKLTEQDLRELGLTIGERKRFLEAIAKRQAAPPAPGPAAATGERRPLTVMFVDLTDSTALGERLDAEDLLEVTRRYREFCGTAIARYGGSIARFVGDGILAYFCYPVANENDPERAVRAALDIVRGISALETPAREPLQVRIGLATGRVVISDLDAGGLEDKRGVTGSLPNEAARLQSVARPNGIVISEHTHARVAARFTCESMGPVEARGFGRLLLPARVIGERASDGGVAIPLEGRRHLTRLYGREAEIDALRAEWQRAAAGEGRVVLVTGEAGIGKSRLVDHVVAHDLPAGTTAVRVAASPFDQDSPLRPFTDRLRMRAGLEVTDGAEAALAKLEAALLGDPGQRHELAVILGGLFGITVDDPLVSSLPPEQLRQKTMAALIAQMVAFAAGGPCCLVIEDLHWLDPTSRELLGQMVNEIGRHRMLMLLTAREGFAADWLNQAQVTVLRLDRLGRDPIAAMMRDLIGDRPLPDRLVDQVVAKTDGVPLFVEEVGRLLLERQGAPSAEDVIADHPEHAIPASLQESLAARLDRSGAAKQVAQIAAVIGRTVRHDMLAQVCAMSRAALEDALSTLVEAGILERHTRLGRDTYSFTHALVRDAAYASLLRERRRELHARVARALEGASDGTAALNPDILALHLTEGGLAEDAAPHCIEAARRSLSRSALTEATRLLRRGLDALEKLPETERTLNLRLQMSALLGPAFIGLKGARAPETRDLYTSAHEMALRLPEDPSHFPVHWGWWRLSSDGRDNLHRSAELLRLATKLGEPPLLLQAHHCCWASHLHFGAFDRFCEHVEAGLGIYEQGDFTHQADLYGNHDAKVCAYGGLSQVYWMQGKLREGLRAEQEALGWAKHLDHLGSRVHAMGLTLLHRVYRRDYTEVFARSGELIDLTSQYGLADHGAAGLIFGGWVMGTQDDPAAGLNMLEEGFARQREIATTEDFPVYLCLLADVLVRLGKPDVAVQRIEQEIPEFERIGLRIWMPELMRVLADTLLVANPRSVERAQALLAEADSLATAQRVPMLGLRVAISRARLDLRLGDTQEAGDRLRTAIRAMPPDEDAADLVEAQQLLRQVGGALLCD